MASRFAMNEIRIRVDGMTATHQAPAGAAAQGRRLAYGDAERRDSKHHRDEARSVDAKLRIWLATLPEV